MPSVIQPLDMSAAHQESFADERDPDPAQVLESATRQAEGDQGTGIRADDRKRRKSGRERLSSTSLRTWAENSGRILDPAPF